LARAKEREICGAIELLVSRFGGESPYSLFDITSQGEYRKPHKPWRLLARSGFSA
jgi:hypothetical protein